MPKICIIITVYNRTDLIKNCLNHIIKTGYENLSVIIFDDGSKSPIEKDLQSYSDRIKNLTFLRSKKNLGFIKANNQALKYGLKYIKHVDFFLLLNSDAYVTEDFFLKSVKYLKRDINLAAPFVFLTQKRGVDTMGIDYYSDGTAMSRKSDRKENYLLAGACLFVSSTFLKECFDKFGFFLLPDLECYFDDVEISLRALLMDKKIYLIPHTLVYHDRWGTYKDEQFRLYYGIRNQFWTILTTWTNKMIKRNLIEILRGQVITSVVYLLKFKNLFIPKIYLETIVSLPRLLKKRKLIQKHLPVAYPNNVFLENPITLLIHIKRSRTYQKIRSFKLLSLPLKTKK